jgi:hypothetical protein
MNFFRNLFSSSSQETQAQAQAQTEARLQNLQQMSTNSTLAHENKEEKEKKQYTASSSQSDLQKQHDNPESSDDTTSPPPVVSSHSDQQTKNSVSGIGAILSSLLQGKLGMDIISAVSLPAWLYEPLTILQRSCETLAHSPLLDQASFVSEPIERLVWVATFGVSGYCGTERFCTQH